MREKSEKEGRRREGGDGGRGEGTDSLSLSPVDDPGAGGAT